MSRYGVLLDAMVQALSATGLVACFGATDFAALTPTGIMGIVPLFGVERNN